MLVLGAGLLAFGLLSLSWAAQVAQAQARVAAETEAARAARELRDKLLQPATLDLAPARQRFEVRDGGVTPPLQVGWVAGPPERVVGSGAREALAKARALEFVDGDAGAAAATLDRAMPAEGLSAGDRMDLALARGFLAHRLGDIEARGRALAVVANGDSIPQLAPGALLLSAAAGVPAPAWALAGMPLVDPERALVVLERMQAAGARDDLGAVRKDVAETADARAKLRAVHDRIGELLAHDTPSTLAMQDDVVVWLPAGGGAGRGAVLPLAAVLDLLQRDELASPLIAWKVGSNPGAGAAVVVENLLAVVPRVGSELRQWMLVASLGVLAALFAAGLLFAFRLLQREARANAARGEFLTSVTHELKTPLASLRLLAEMLDEGRVTDEKRRREYYRMLASETVRLQALIENVLDLGRVERGERALDLRPCEVGEVVRDAVAVMTPVVARDGKTLKVRGDGASLRARVDRAALTQALLNVIDNARKYGAGDIEVDVVAGATSVRVTVRDRGPGVPFAERERIFERFVRGHAHASGTVPGVGLGLYLARAIATAHGGSLTCEDPVDGGPGAVFAFTLPLVGGRDDAKGKDKAVESERLEGPL